MNARCSILLLAALLTCSRGEAADSFTYESQAELSATIDPVGDGTAALIVLDKTSGVRQLAMPQSDGTFQWAEPTSTGFDDVTALTIGFFTCVSNN